MATCGNLARSTPESPEFPGRFGYYRSDLRESVALQPNVIVPISMEPEPNETTTTQTCSARGQSRTSCPRSPLQLLLGRHRLVHVIRRYFSGFQHSGQLVQGEYCCTALPRLLELRWSRVRARA
jgi:hypothetical protein